LNNNNIITYSRSVTVILSKICQNNCLYCDYNFSSIVKESGKDDLIVPYSVISLCKEAKKKGVREVTLSCGQRPDEFTAVRAKLDNWGFSSFIDYVYTIAELCFLEGLLPHLDVGYITKDEITVIRRIVTSLTISLDSIDEEFLNKIYNSPYLGLNKKLEMIKNAAEGKLPVTLRMMVGFGESVKSRKETLEAIKKIQEKYGNIQNVILQNFIPRPGTDMADKKATDRNTLLNTIESARKILPEDVVISVNYAHDQGTPFSFIKAGVMDFGNFDYLEEKKNKLNYNSMLEDVSKSLLKHNMKFQHRLPIFSKYIMLNWYSRKLAQVLDKYRSVLKISDKVNVEED
jgi:7,8-didemethyl-8-hydroxy-5-deazariboflavin synthase